MAFKEIKLSPPGINESPMVDILIPQMVYADATSYYRIVPDRFGEKATTWMLIEGVLVLVCTADVANRIFGISKYTQENKEISTRMLSGNVAASATYALQLGNPNFNNNGTFRNLGATMGLNPLSCMIKSGDYWKVYIDANAQVGDKFDGALRFLYLGAGRDIWLPPQLVKQL
jgi:hypothetical protein